MDTRPADASRTDSIRLFFALWPDEAVRGALSQLQTMVKGRPTAYGNLHLTLAFLGQQPLDRLPALRSLLHGLPGTGMRLEIDRLGYFARARIAWAGASAPPPALGDLRGALLAALAREGIAFDGGGRFRPHVTLARNAAPPPDLAFAPIDWPVREIALVESDLQARGPVYRVLESRLLDDC